MKGTSVMAGYRRYLSKKHLRGLYLEPYVKYLHHTGDGIGNTTLNGEAVSMHFTNDYKGIGLGAQLGAQFIISKRIVIDLFFLGPEINSAKDNFKAVEITNAIPWNEVQANEAQKDIKDFVDQFPFVGNKTTVTVDKSNRTVTAGFKGALPGVRAGVSFGIAL